MPYQGHQDKIIKREYLPSKKKFPLNIPKKKNGKRRVMQKILKFYKDLYRKVLKAYLSMTFVNGLLSLFGSCGSMEHYG